MLISLGTKPIGRDVMLTMPKSETPLLSEFAMLNARRIVDVVAKKYEIELTWQQRALAVSRVFEEFMAAFMAKRDFSQLDVKGWLEEIVAK
jgi:hypothetical protein